MNHKLVGHRIVSKSVFYIARVLSSVSSGDLLDEQGSLRQLAHSVVLLEDGALDLPLQVRRRHSHSQARQFHILLVGGGERVIE
jgi:hypothetical protein